MLISLIAVYNCALQLSCQNVIYYLGEKNDC